MASLWELFVQISGDNSGFKQSVKDSGDSLMGFDKLASDVGGRVAGYLSVTALAGGILASAEAFDKAGVQIQRSTGATGQRLDGLTASMKSLYSGTAQSQSAIGSALSEVTIKTGLQGNALESLTKSWINFAKVTGQEVTPAVQTNQQLFAQWGVTAESQQYAMDMLVAGWQRGGGTMEHFSAQMLGTATTLKTVGFSFEDAVALVSNFTKSGLDADTIVRGLTSTMGKWAVAGKDPRAMLDDLVGAMGRAKTDTDALALAQDAGMGKSSKAMVQAVKDGAFALDSSKQQLEAAKGKTDDLAASTTTLGEEVTKTWHAFSLMGAEIGGPLAGFLADCLRQVRELDASFGKMEKSIIDWVGDSGLMSIIGPAARVVNNALNPWASGNYINNLTTDAPVPSMPKAPRGPVPSDLAYGGVTTNSGVTAPGNAPGDKTRPLSQESDSLAVLIDRYHDAIAAHKATIEEIAKSGLSIPDFWAKQATDATASAVAFDKLGNAVEPQKSIFEALAPTIDKCDKLLKEMGIDTAKSAQEALAASPFGKLADSAQYFGITTAHAYDTAAKTAEAKFDQMLQSGIATNRELAIAALKMGQAEIDADLAAGKISDAYHNKVRAQMDADLAKWTNTEKKKQSLSDQVTAETKRLTTSMFNSMEKGLASDIVHWKGFGATIKSVFQTMGEDVLSILLHALLKPVEKLMGDLLGRLTGDLVTNFAIDKAAASATDVGQVAGAAAVGGAAATASIAAIPIVGPAAAPAAGAAMYAEIMGVYSPLAVFAKGGIAGEDMIAGLRRKEMVLPEDISIPLRAAIKAGSFSGGGGVTVTGNNFYGVSKDTVNQLANQMVRQARLAGAKI